MAQAALAERDVFIRVCTPAAQRSLRMTVEASAFRSSQAEERRRRQAHRIYINLLLDPGYVPEPFDNATLFVDGVSRARPLWIADLGRALGMGPAARVLNRRAFVGLGAAVALTVESAAATGVVLINQKPATSKPSLDLHRTPGQVRWQAETNTYGDSGLALSNGVLYAVGDSKHGILAFRATDGHKLWSNALVYNGNSGVAPAVAGQALYVAASTGDLYALDTKTGKRIWRATVGQNNPTIPVAAGDTVYLATDDDTLYAIDTATQAVRWKFKTGASVESSPLVLGGIVYFGSDDGYVYALDATAGTKRWSYKTRAGVYSSPVIVNGVLYIGSQDSSVCALDPQRGTLVRKYKTGGPVYSTPIIKDGVLYIGSYDKYLYAYNA